MCLEKVWGVWFFARLGLWMRFSLDEVNFTFKIRSKTDLGEPSGRVFPEWTTLALERQGWEVVRLCGAPTLRATCKRSLKYRCATKFVFNAFWASPSIVFFIASHSHASTLSGWTWLWNSDGLTKTSPMGIWDRNGSSVVAKVTEVITAKTVREYWRERCLWRPPSDKWLAVLPFY